MSINKFTTAETNKMTQSTITGYRTLSPLCIKECCIRKTSDLHSQCKSDKRLGTHAMKKCDVTDTQFLANSPMHIMLIRR